MPIGFSGNGAKRVDGKLSESDGQRLERYYKRAVEALKKDDWIGLRKVFDVDWRRQAQNRSSEQSSAFLQNLCARILTDAGELLLSAINTGDFNDNLGTGHALWCSLDYCMSNGGLIRSRKCGSKFKQLFHAYISRCLANVLCHVGNSNLGRLAPDTAVSQAKLATNSFRQVLATLANHPLSYEDLSAPYFARSVPWDQRKRRRTADYLDYTNLPRMLDLIIFTALKNEVTFPDAGFGGVASLAMLVCSVLGASPKLDLQGMKQPWYFKNAAMVLKSTLALPSAGRRVAILAGVPNSSIQDIMHYKCTYYACLHCNSFFFRTDGICRSDMSSAQEEAEDKRAKDFKKCSGCEIAMYCSSACQKADWQRHKLGCKLTYGQS